MRDPRSLGEGIRRLRKERGLTQAALAARLYVSPQNISKWETGLSAPDVGNLCLLAEALSVPIDRLFFERGTGGAMIGIDGGGTKTEFCLFNDRGEVLERVRLSGSNPNVYGMEQAQATLKNGIDALMGRENGVCAIFAGIAGCGAEGNRHGILSYLKRCYPDVRIEVKNDAYSVIYSTPYFERCVMAIMGTGSVVFAKTPEEFVRFGGWGYLLDNGFSGFAIARDALMAALDAEEGSGPPTVLLEMLKTELGGGIFDNNPKLYKMPKEEIAAYAKLVFEAYRMGDAVAMRILRERANVLVRTLDRATECYDVRGRVILAGGLLRDREIVMELLGTDRYSYVIPTLPPIYGACHYCARMLGEPPEDFGKNFERSYAEIIKE